MCLKYKFDIDCSSAQGTLSCLSRCNIPPTYRPTTLVTDRLPAHSSSFFALICAETYRRLVDPHQLDGDCILSPPPLLIACLTHSCASSFFAGIYPLLVDIKIYDSREKIPGHRYLSHTWWAYEESRVSKSSTQPFLTNGQMRVRAGQQNGQKIVYANFYQKAD